MSESEESKKVSHNDLRGSQFGGGIVDAGTVNAQQIGNTVNKTNNYINVTIQIQTMLIPVVENSQKISEQLKPELKFFLNQLLNDVQSLENSGDTNNLLAEAHEYQIKNISEIESIYAHYLLAKYLEPIRVRCNLVLATSTATLKAIDISNFYEDEYIYEAAKTFCDSLYVCVDWLYQSVKWFYAFPLPDSSKNDLSTCPKELLEYAFESIKNEAKSWDDNPEVATEVNVYLNLLIQQLNLS